MTGNRGGITGLVVGAVLGAALVTVAFWLGGLVVGLILSVLLVFEGWTLINNSPEDTISEIMWTLSVRPMVPWMFGCASGAWLMWVQHFVTIPPRFLWLSLAAGFLQGHFFFQAQKTQEAAVATKVAEAAAEEPLRIVVGERVR